MSISSRLFALNMAPEKFFSRARRFRLHESIIVLMYHEVLEKHCSVEAWTVVGKEAFRSQMLYLTKHFDVLPLQTALAAMFSDTPQPPGSQPRAVVTFDDGYRGNARAALPIIRELGLPITVFISTAALQNGALYWYDSLILALQSQHAKIVSLDLRDFGLRRYNFQAHWHGEKRWSMIQQLLSDLKTLSIVDRETAVDKILLHIDQPRQPVPLPLAPLSLTELGELARSPLVTIGAHSHGHQRLVQLSLDEVRSDLSRCRQLLEQWTERPIQYLSYPNGDYSDEIMAEAQRLGFRGALTTETKAWKRSDWPLAIPRIGIGRWDNLGVFKAKVSGLLT